MNAGDRVNPFGSDDARPSGEAVYAVCLPVSGERKSILGSSGSMPVVRLSEVAQGISIASEKELERRFAEGSRQAMGELVRRHREELQARAARLAGATLASDAVQDLTVRLLLRHTDYDPQFPWLNWAYRILRNLCIDILRRESRYEGLSDLGSRPVLDPATSTAVEREELRHQLRECIGTLTIRARKALFLKYSRLLTLEEIGSQIGVARTSVHRLLKRAIRTLGDCLSKAGFGDSHE